MQLSAALAVLATSVALGLLVVVRGRQRRVGWLLVAHGVTTGALLGFPDAASTSRAGLITDQLSQGAWVFLFLWLALIAYLLPDGHPRSAFWSRWMGAGLLGVVLFLVGAAGDRESFAEAHDGRAAPLRWLPSVFSDTIGIVGLLMVVMLIVGSFVALGQRVRTASGEDRVRLLWPVWGSLSVPAVLAFGWANHFLLGDHPGPFAIALVFLGLALPATISISVLRHRLFDIELVLSRTLVYAVLTLLVVGSYAGLLTLAGAAFGNRQAGGLVAVGLVAVLVHPTYAWLRRHIDTMVYGYRSDPAEALRRLGASVESADVFGVIDTITTSIADALKAERSWVEAVSTTEPASRADPTVRRVPLRHRGEHLGDLAIELRPGRALTPAEEALLDDLARYAAVMVKAATLARELQESRSLVISAREEERKRLRRDLHDGVGPSLAAIVLKLDAAQTRRTDGERNNLLEETREETKATIREVRRLVDDLRPPAIDEVGLIEAIGQRAAALSTDTLTCTVSGPASLPALTAAVEVAAFRIASEAMTNSARHSGASRCTVDVELDTALHLTIADNGRGSAAPTPTGVGWSSMIERASELGGSCTIMSGAEGGLVVRAVLPLQSSPRQTDAVEATT